MCGMGMGCNDKILVMEDGVFVVLVFYLVFFVYYFFIMGCMELIEVFKGVVFVKYGLCIIGGVLNLVFCSLLIEGFKGLFNVEFGSDGFYKGYVYFGKKKNNVVGFVEVFIYGVDGFKDLFVGSDNIGFEKNDFLLKFGFDFGDNEVYSLEMKLKYLDECFDEMYMGLIDVDY